MRESEEVALRSLDLFALAAVIFLEARGGTGEEQIAVGYVPVNRRDNPAMREDAICKAIARPFQFTPIHQHSFRNVLEMMIDEPMAWHNALNTARLIIAGDVADPTDEIGGANHFHAADMRPLPPWAKPGFPSMQIGGTIFYHLPPRG